MCRRCLRTRLKPRTPRSGLATPPYSSIDVVIVKPPMLRLLHGELLHELAEVAVAMLDTAEPLVDLVEPLAGEAQLGVEVVGRTGRCRRISRWMSTVEPSTDGTVVRRPWTDEAGALVAVGVLQSGQILHFKTPVVRAGHPGR